MLTLCLNATTLNKGGALQACVSFIKSAAQDRDLKWVFLVSTAVWEELSKGQVKLDSERIALEVFPRSPARSPSARHRVRKAVEKYPDIALVFTFFGPAYVRFQTPHLMGFADGWVTHPNHYCWNLAESELERFKRRLTIWYKRQWMKAADYYVVEAEVAVPGVTRISGAQPGRVIVIPNSYRDDLRGLRLTRGGNEVRILYLTAYYPHKKIEMIPSVSRALMNLRPDLRFRFVLTIEESTAAVKKMLLEAESLGVRDRISCVGRVSVEEIASVYESAALSFMPTVLETFSAGYLEAMAVGIPIVTSDLDFAHSICHDAAFYFRPADPEDAARTIVMAIENISERDQRIERGHAIATCYPSELGKYDRYKEFILTGVLGAH